ncbi:efflux RND transporter periplasmic adaptor subunit [Polyangium spumosum]|uniref:efflux RND transporter periplasmic adaptor subunit n=1 Tax=Polyangium spumosum TaxID=889282 RepID=UPI00129A4C6C
MPTDLPRRAAPPFAGLSSHAYRVSPRVRVLRTLSIFVALLLHILACKPGVKPEPSATAEPGLALPVASPVVADRSIEREYVAEIRAARHAEIRSRIKGVIEAVAVDEGQAVKAGDTLFSIDARALKKEVLAARAAAATAEAELRSGQLERENMQLLIDKDVVSKAEITLVDAKIQTLKAKVEEARAGAGRAAVELGYATVKAPFDGFVNRIPRKVGSAVAEDELLTTITDTSDVYAYFRVSEREYLEYSAASAERPKEVTLKLADGSTFPVKGVIDTIESEFDRETGTIAFRAKFSNAAGTLKHGSSGKVVLATDLRGALLVPQKSTFEMQGEVFVYALDADNTARARRLVPGARLSDTFVVESGLQKDDRFVLEGVQKVKDGARIHVRPADASAAR